MQKINLTSEWKEITGFSGNLTIQSKDNSNIEYHKGDNVPVDNDNTYILKPLEIQNIFVGEKLFAKSADREGILIVSQGSTAGGSGSIDYSSILNSIKTSVNNIEVDTDAISDILNAVDTLEQILLPLNFGFKNIINPSNLNVNTITNNIKYLCIYVKTGNLNLTHLGNTITLTDGEVLEIGNKIGLINNDLVLNGTCNIIISWEV